MSQHYFPITAEHREAMLSQIGVAKFSDLVKGIPAKLCCPRLELPDSLSEMEAVQHLEELAVRNGYAGKIHLFAGAGAYEHFIPAAVSALTSRGEFATAYTPYQAEASQGTLEALFEFQTMICELTGMKISNASLYDGATSLAEACLVAIQTTKRNEIMLAETIHPEYRDVVETYVKGVGAKMELLGFDQSGGMDRKSLELKLTDRVAALVVQTPNFFGRVENLTGVADMVHARGALLIIVANPLALGYFRSPGEWGADIACGELQPLGIPLGYGGPYAGYFTTTEALMRRIPGRICGETVDAEGARAFTLTLQAREQHIRRERATSNICTNQALMALRAAVYLSLMGKRGMARVAELNMENAYYLREKLAALAGVSVPFKGPIFNEFVVRFKIPADEVLTKMRAKNVIGGVRIGRWYKGQDKDLLVAVTETKAKAVLDQYVSLVKEIL